MKILTVEQVAKMLALNKFTVYQKARKGEIPAFRIGRSWRFSQEEIENWFGISTSAASSMKLSSRSPDREAPLEQRLEALMKLREEIRLIMDYSKRKKARNTSRVSKNPLHDIIGIFDGPPDLSKNIDKILYGYEDNE